LESLVHRRYPHRMCVAAEVCCDLSPDRSWSSRSFSTLSSIMLHSCQAQCGPPLRLEMTILCKFKGLATSFGSISDPSCRRSATTFSKREARISSATPICHPFVRTPRRQEVIQNVGTYVAQCQESQVWRTRHE
jgi:hypothetical protein